MAAVAHDNTITLHEILRGFLTHGNPSALWQLFGTQYELKYDFNLTARGREHVQGGSVACCS